MFKRLHATQMRADSELPPEFDARYYRKRYPDLKNLTERELENHYASCGIRDGRQGSPAANRSEFVKLAGEHASVLEIGPFANPALRGANVSYFDVLNTQDLRRRAAAHGVDPKDCPAIDYVSPVGDLSVIDRTFAAVFSSHVIEHQPDLVMHLQNVAKLLEADAHYFLAVPDKRFCFDHFITESAIAGVIDAHARELRRHDVRSVVEHLAMTTHNDALRHWHGDHGEPNYKNNGELFRAAVGLALYDPAYVDSHAWQFTPESFREIVTLLHELRLSPFSVERLYPTTFGSNEFYAVLRKRDMACEALCEQLPAEFDEKEYLAANPDVAAAAANAAMHYLCFGRKEGRKLHN